jgi:hypothetical protein
MTDKLKFQRGNRWFVVEVEADEDHGAPWDNEDGHGVIETRENDRRQGTHPAKRAGERVLMNTGFGTAFYDFKASCKKAREEGWGWLPGKLETKELATGQWQATAGELTAYGTNINDATRALYALAESRWTPRAYFAKAVEADYQRLCDWVEDRWHYVGIVVTMLDEDNETPRPLYRESLWGIESDSDASYFEEEAGNLADEILARIGDK